MQRAKAAIKAGDWSGSAPLKLLLTICLPSTSSHIYIVSKYLYSQAELLSYMWWFDLLKIRVLMACFVMKEPIKASSSKSWGPRARRSIWRSAKRSGRTSRWGAARRSESPCRLRAAQTKRASHLLCLSKCRHSALRRCFGKRTFSVLRNLTNLVNIRQILEGSFSALSKPIFARSNIRVTAFFKTYRIHALMHCSDSTNF